jgi:hypothetical protein
LPSGDKPLDEHGRDDTVNENGLQDGGGLMQDHYQDDVADWFERSSLARIMERRTRGITADFVLDELVRRPADPSRTSATTLTTRTTEPDPTPPGQGEWHGASHRIIPAHTEMDPAYVAQADRVAAFAQALTELEQVVGPDLLHAALYGPLADASVRFSDRRHEGRRHRPIDTDGIIGGDQRPYPNRRVGEERYERF